MSGGDVISDGEVVLVRIFLDPVFWWEVHTRKCRHCRSWVHLMTSQTVTSGCAWSEQIKIFLYFDWFVKITENKRGRDAVLNLIPIQCSVNIARDAQEAGVHRFLFGAFI